MLLRRLSTSQGDGTRAMVIPWVAGGARGVHTSLMQGSRVREENQASVVLSHIASVRQEEFGSGLRPRLETAGGDEIEALYDPEEEPISPELILVSSPEVARRAREQLAVPSHRPAYDEATAATSEATAVLRELRAVVP